MKKIVKHLAFANGDESILPLRPEDLRRQSLDTTAGAQRALDQPAIQPTVSDSSATELPAAADPNPAPAASSASSNSAKDSCSIFGHTFPRRHCIVAAILIPLLLVVLVRALKH